MNDSELHAALEPLGFSPPFRDAFRELRDRTADSVGWVPARVVGDHKGVYNLDNGQTRFLAEISGRMMNEAVSGEDYPAVGDWVALEPPAGEASRGMIHVILPRQTRFRRKAAGHHQSRIQVVAANVDTVFLMSGLDANFNPRRIERYYLQALDSGARAVVVLNKADLCNELEVRLKAVRPLVGATPLHAISVKTGEGIDALKAYLGVGHTLALLGSSGVGKSSLINALIGEERLAVGEVREEDSRGRHTTTRRELHLLGELGMIIDTPGMRELQVWADEEELGNAFEEIDRIARECRFRDCRHEAEPGCAVRTALEAGEIDPARYASYAKLRGEIRAREENSWEGEGRRQRRKGKRMGKMVREVQRHNPKYRDRDDD